MLEYLEQVIPGLRGRAYQGTSPATEDYNCIAWAASDTRPGMVYGSVAGVLKRPLRPVSSERV
jgi:hypothetical protein